MKKRKTDMPSLKPLYYENCSPDELTRLTQLAASLGYEMLRGQISYSRIDENHKGWLEVAQEERKIRPKLPRDRTILGDHFVEFRGLIGSIDEESSLAQFLTGKSSDL